MPEESRPHDEISLPALLRHARTTYAGAMRSALSDAGYDDIPKNGLYLLGGMALGPKARPLSELIDALALSKQAAGQLVDTLVQRGYLSREVDALDRRRLSIALSPKGRAAATVIETARRTVDATLLARVGPQALGAARRTMLALIDIGRGR